MVTLVDTGPLLTAFGEDVTITPDGGEAVTAKGIVSTHRSYGPAGDFEFELISVSLPASPAYAVRDAMVVRGQAMVVTAVDPGDDAGWTRYFVGLT